MPKTEAFPLLIPIEMFFFFIKIECNLLLLNNTLQLIFNNILSHSEYCSRNVEVEKQCDML